MNLAVGWLPTFAEMMDRVISDRFFDSFSVAVVVRSVKDIVALTTVKLPPLILIQPKFLPSKSRGLI